MTAGLAVLRDGGAEAFTIGAVSAGSGVSVGAIYRRFGSKERLLRYLHDRAMDEYEARCAAEFAPAPFETPETAQLVRAAVRTMVGLIEERRELLRAFAFVTLGDAEVARRATAANDVHRELFVGLLMTRADDYAHEDPAVAVRIVYRIVFDALLPRVMFSTSQLDPLPGLSWQRIVDELGRACVAYLLAPSAPAR